MASEDGGDRKRVRWGILGTGFIADAFSTGVSHSETGRLEAVASRTQATADAFAARFPEIRRAHARYGDLIDDPDVDAVYVATPHPFHAELAVQAAQAGKAVLCEKPLGMDAGEARTILGAARDAGTFLMEGYMYRLAPQTALLAKLIRDGRIGRVVSVEASFCFRAPFDPKSRLFDPALGGGGILDVGGYPVSAAALVAGAAAGGRWENPTEFAGCGTVGRSGVDEFAAAVARYPSGVIARLACAVGADEIPGGIRVHGTGGSLHVPDAWLPAKHGGSTTITLGGEAGDGGREHITVDSPGHLYSLEADAAGEAILAGLQEPAWPAVGWEESEAIMTTLDRWRHAVIGGGKPAAP